MRCPSCGTQNEPDSRFCGGCGARLHGTLAPTQKVVPDPVVQAAQPPPRASTPAPSTNSKQAMAYDYTPAPVIQRPSPSMNSGPPQMPAPIAPAAPSRSQPRPSGSQVPQRSQAQSKADFEVTTPRSARPSGPSPATMQQRPSGAQRSASTPPGVASRPATAPAVAARSPSGRGVASGSSRARSSPAAPASEGVSISSSPVVAKRNWALIVIVLLFDLGLAGAGVYLLVEGLRSGAPASSEEPSPGSAAKTGSAEAPKPAPRAEAPAPPPPPPAKPAIDATPVAAPVETPSPAITPSNAPAPTPTQTQGRTTPIKRPPKRLAPVDPYQDPPEPTTPTGPVVGPPPPPPDHR